MLIISVVPLPIPHYSVIAPSFSVMAVFCWTLWRPDLFPYAAVFAIGLFEDFLRGTPFGVCALTLLVVQGVVRSQSRLLHGKSFEVLWLGFAMVAAGAAIFRWMVMSVMNDTVISLSPVLFHYLATVALFPLLAMLLLRLQHAVLKQV